LAHIFAMTDEERFSFRVIFFGAAAGLAAVILGNVAHYGFGLSQEAIRIPAIIGAAVIALLIAVVFFGKKLRKPK
jgi:purine-cytosine permease-like protein